MEREMLRRETERPGKILKVGGQRVVCAGCLLRLGHKYQRGLAHSEESRATEQCGSLCFALLDTLTTACWLLAAVWKLCEETASNSKCRRQLRNSLQGALYITKSYKGSRKLLFYKTMYFLIYLVNSLLRTNNISSSMFLS